MGPRVSELEYKSVEGMRSKFTYMGSSTTQLAPNPSVALEKEPVYFSKRPLYSALEMGTAQYAFVFDESGGTGSGYDTLLMDGNNNKDLTDDPRIAFSVGSTDVPPVEITVEHSGRSHPYHLSVYPCGASPNHTHMSSSGYCEGELTLGDKTYRVALFDDNCNGTFNDAYAIPAGSPTNGPVRAQGDALVIDLDGDGQFSKQLNDTPEMFHVGKHLSLGDRCYDLDIDPSGRKVTVRETESACGYITTNQKGYSVDLLGEAGGLRLTGDSRKVKVPAGEYRIVSCNLEGQDDGGDPWRIVGQGDWNLSTVEIAPGENVAMKLGQPLTATITAGRNGDSFNLGLEIKGQGGETYAPNTFMKNGSPVPAPRFEVRDSRGEIIARGQFAYG
jgi:hypothetical protein